MKTSKPLGILIAVMLSTTSVHASQFYIDIGSNYGGYGQKADGLTTTGLFDYANFKYSSTSVITDANNDGFYSPGDTVATTGGVDNVMEYGIGSNSISNNRITDFSPSATFWTQDDPALNGYGTDWNLAFGVHSTGYVNSTGGINYNGGFIEFYLYDKNSSSNKLPVLRVDVTDGGQNAVGLALDVSGLFNFSGINLTSTIGSSTVNDLFNSTSGSFGDAWSEGNLRLNFDSSQTTGSFWVNGVKMDTPNFTNFYTTAGGTGILSGLHDGRLEFDIPEPSVLLLLGIGLSILGIARMPRTATTSI